MAFKLAELFARLSLNRAEFNTGLRDTKGQLDSLANRTKSVAGQIRNVFALAVAGGVFKHVIDAFSEQEDAEKKLQRILEQTGNVTGFTKDQLVAMAESLQGTTKFADEATIAAQAMLAQFTNIRGDIFKDALTSAQDFAEFTGKDLSTATRTLGRALNDPVKGMMLLRRAGIVVTDEMKNYVGGLIESGRVTEAQRFILQKFQEKFGGQAAAAAETTRGKMVQLKNAIGDLGEVVGQLIVQSGLLDFINALKTHIVDLNKRWQELSPSIKQTISSVVKWVGVGLAAFVAGKLLMTVFGGIGSMLLFLVSNPITLLIAGLAAVVGSLIYASIEGETWQDKMRTVINAVSGYWTKFVGWFKGAMEVLGFVVRNWGDIWQLVWIRIKEFVANIGVGIVTMWTNLTEFAGWFGRNWKDIFKTALDAVLTMFINFGSNIRALVSAIWDFMSGKGWQMPQFKKLTEGTRNYVKEELKLTKPHWVQLEDERNKVMSRIQKRELQRWKDLQKQKHDEENKIVNEKGAGGFEVSMPKKKKDKDKAEGFAEHEIIDMWKKVQEAAFKDNEQPIEEEMLDVEEDTRDFAENIASHTKDMRDMLEKGIAGRFA